MKAPKLLPWIARKAGIDDERARELWAQATRWAAERVGNSESAEFFAAANAALLDLVEQEASARQAPTSLGWVWRYQRRMLLHSLTASQSAYRWWEQLRRRLHGRGWAAP